MIFFKGWRLGRSLQKVEEGEQALVRGSSARLDRAAFVGRQLYALEARATPRSQGAQHIPQDGLRIQERDDQNRRLRHLAHSPGHHGHGDHFYWRNILNVS